MKHWSVSSLVIGERAGRYKGVILPNYLDAHFKAEAQSKFFTVMYAKRTMYITTLKVSTKQGLKSKDICCLIMKLHST